MGASQSVEEPQSRRVVLENEDGNCKVRSINIPTDSLAEHGDGSAISLSEELLISLLEEDRILVAEDKEWVGQEEIEDEFASMQGLEAVMLPQFSGPLTSAVLPLPDMLQDMLPDTLTDSQELFTESALDEPLVMEEHVGYEGPVELALPELASRPQDTPEAEVVQEAARIIAEPIIQEVVDEPVEEAIPDIMVPPPVLEKEPVVEQVTSKPAVSKPVVSKPAVPKPVVSEPVPESSMFQKIFDFRKPVEPVSKAEDVAKEAPRQVPQVVPERVIPAVASAPTTTKLAESLFDRYRQQEVEKVIMEAKLEGAKEQARLDADVMSGILSNERARWRNKFNVVEQSLQKRKADITAAHESAVAMVTSQLNIPEDKSRPCGTNVTDIIDCYASNPGKTLLCKELTDSFERCVSQTLTSR